MSAEPNIQPILVDKGELENSIAQYKQQSAIITAQLQQLEQQKAVALKTIDMLSGAVQALEQLVTNINDREKTREKTAEVANALGQPVTQLPTPPAVEVREGDGADHSESPEPVAVPASA